MNGTEQQLSKLSYLLANKIIVQDGFIIKKYNDKVLEFSSEIESNWLKQKNARGNSLTNGSILNLGRIEKEQEQLVLRCHAIEYKHFLAQRSGIDLGITLLAVSGLTFFRSNNKKVFLLARRSDNVTQFPKMFELIPSGSIDVLEDRLEATQIYYKKQLIRELCEEIGVPENKVISTNEFCLLRDEEDVYDIGIEIEISKKNDFKLNDQEYSELKEMDFNSLSDKLEESNSLKTSKILLKAWSAQHE